MENVILKSEDKRSRAEIVAFLRETADKIETGNIKLIQGENTVELDIPENLTLEIKVEEKLKQDTPYKMQLEIELEWRLGEKKESIELG